MQKKLKGIAVSPGVAICPALVLDAVDRPIARRIILSEQVPVELSRIEQALASSREELAQLRQDATDVLGEELAGIFAFHAGMLADSTLLERIRTTLERERVSAEYAVHLVLQQYAQAFLDNDSLMLRERVSDIRDIERRLLRHLIDEGAGDLQNLTGPTVLVAHDLTPSQTASLDRERVKAIATDAGGRTSHTAILAHALGIPAVVGIEDATESITSGKTVIVDGRRGVVIVEPDAATLLEYRQEVDRLARRVTTLVEVRDLPAVTRDGTEIHLYANIEFSHEIEEALHCGATGVGLFRTEFLFLASDHAPSEEEQYETYLDALQRLQGRPLTIRTLDLGADKITSNVSALRDHTERNPFLGCRSIRLCLQNLDLFRTQLRAILRASAHGPVRVMFPLISNIMELRQARMIFNDVKEDMEDQGLAYGEKIPVGIMIEVPSVAIQAAAFVREVDFFSIGTNDLIQYTVAVDRSNERIANLYSAAHPAVISLIRDVIRVAQRHKIGVGLCGEMAGQVEYTMLLLGLGLRSFSVSPPALPEIKQLIRQVSVEQCRRVARKVTQFDSDRQVLGYLREELSKTMPDVYDGRSIDF